MKRFKNIVTGKICHTKNAETEKMLERSEQYVAVADAKKPKSKDTDDKN